MTTEETTPEPDTDRAVAGARESFDSADYSEDFAAAGPADTTVTDDAPDAVIDDPSPKAPPQYGVGPLSIREISILGVWIVAFIVSFFPIYGEVGSGPSVWTNGIDWVLTIFVPTIAVFLLILRRFSPEGIRRVGSLGVDQFASVAFSVSTVIWLGILLELVRRSRRCSRFLRDLGRLRRVLPDARRRCPDCLRPVHPGPR